MYEKERKIVKDIRPTIMALDGVISVGLCTEQAEPVIKIEMLEGYSPRILPDIKELPVRVAFVKDYEKPLMQDTILDLKKRQRPVSPGLQIVSINGRGSNGFSIYHKGERYLITAAHLQHSWQQGDGIGQNFYSRRVAELEKWINIYGYPRTGGPGDYAAYKYLPDMSVSNRFIENRFVDFKPLRVLEPEIGMKIVRVGSTTGIRFDEIVEVDAAVRLQGVGDNPHWTCGNVFMWKYRSALPGDSGGGIFCLDPPGVLGVCMYSAGGSTATDGLQYMGFGRCPDVVGMENSIYVEMFIDNPVAKINGEAVYVDPDNLEIAPSIVDGRTRVPLRFIHEVVARKAGQKVIDNPVIDWFPKDGRTERIIMEI